MTRREWLAAWAAGLLLPDPGSFGPDAQTSAVTPVRDDPTTWSMAELEGAYARGEVTPLEVTAAYLKHIDALDPALGAFVTVSRDRALDETRRLLRRPPGDATRSGLFGVPVAHKDLFATRAVRTTGGSRLHADWVPDVDADLVARCTRAGTVLLGKTNTHELGGGVTTINPFTGTTKNPRDQARIPGGSSGGSAAAVAARLTLLATGSDTGGSIRIPAALCGCVGVKPTFGLLPTTGLLGACPSFDHAGVLTRSVDDAARALAALLAPADGGDATFAKAYRAAAGSALRGRRIGVARAYFCEALEPDVEHAFSSALARLRDAGATTVDVPLGLDASSYDTMFAPTVVHEIRTTYARAWQSHPEAFSPEFATVFTGPPPHRRDLSRATTARAAHARTLASLFSQVDVLVMPTVPMVAPLIAGPIDGMRILRNTWAANAAGVPAISLPCGTGANGLPVGLQLVGARRADAHLLGLASAIERHLATPAQG